MVCHGHDPPDNSHREFSPPAIQSFVPHGEDSDEDLHDYVVYELLPQGPDGYQAPPSVSDDETEENEQNCSTPNNVPPIEPVEITLTRDLWDTPRSTDSIEMDKNKAEQVMSAMANFVLPQSAIPEWARSITDEQWKKTISDRLATTKK